MSADEAADAAGPDARPVPEPTGVDMARVALRAAKEQARARGTAARERRQARRGGGLRSGARRDGRDPMRLGDALERLQAEHGWEMPMAVGGVMGRWPQIVGDDLARHCEPLAFDEEERVLRVRCDTTAWATQVRLLAPQLLRRLNDELGRGTVRRIDVRGPQSPVGRAGPLRAPGSRGPGDTYG
jgi:predicted nucleic acid-binding Zn ribbon protein